MARYLDIKKYKTKNLLKPMTMRITPHDESINEYEEKFESQRYIIENASKLAAKYTKKIKEGTLNLEMHRKIRMIKREAMLHNKMLEEKMKGEIEKGAYEYANYLVSMLNAGTSNYIIDK